jgi:hypothetical protein
MKKSLNILTYLLILTRCFGQESAVGKVEVSKLVEEIDTIIERNNPNSVDFNKHQLFIDTTRTYLYYDRIENWNPFENSKETTLDYLNDLYGDKNLVKFDFKDFPRLWITLRQYQNEFMLYDRCDGMETSYGLTDSIFYIFGVHEFDIRKIKRMVQLNDNELEIELEKYKGEENEKPLIVNIQKTERKAIYKLTYNLNYIFVTSNENVRNFDVLVNHCPINKVIEFDNKFDN